MKKEVKQHLRKNKKTGKIETVKRHLRDVKYGRKNDVLTEEQPKGAVIFPEKDQDNNVVVAFKKRLPNKEEMFVSPKKKMVMKNPETPQFIEEKYRNNYPITWAIMKRGKWKEVKDKNGEKKLRLILSEREWKSLLKEHMPLISNIARKYSYGQSFGDKFEEMKSIATSGFFEGVNAYGKYFNPSNPPDFAKVVFAFSSGRVKESVSNDLKNGLRIPQYLKKHFSDYLEAKELLESKGKTNPSDEDLAEILSKKWNKKTFYPSYLLAGERRYKVKIKVHGKNKFVIREKTFDEVYEQLLKKNKRLANQFKKQEMEKDKLPLNGFITISKIGTVENKLEKHKINIENIENEYKDSMEKLEKEFEISKTVERSDLKFGETIIKEREQKLAKIEEERLKLVEKKLKSQRDIETEKNKLEKENNAINKKIEKEKNRYQKTKLKKQFKTNSNRLEELKNDSYINPKTIELNKQINTVQTKKEELEKELKAIKEFYKPFDEQEYNKKKEFIEMKRNSAIEEETKRYNKDNEQSLIPGVYERIREFREIENTKNLPLDVKIEGEEGEGLKNEEIVFIQKDLSPDTISELIETHTLNKNLLKEYLDYLNPLHKDITSLRMGLHKTSQPTADNLWGKLAEIEDIRKYLDKKYNVFLSDPKRFLRVLSGYEKNEQHLFINRIPYVLRKYRTDPDALINDYEKWLSSNPSDRKVKIKMDKKDYRKLYKKWIENKKKARKEFILWKKKNPNTDQKQKKAKYEQIKIKNKAKAINKPSRFVLVKQASKENREQWLNKFPMPFYESEGRKDVFINDVLNDSYYLLRKHTPIKIISNLLEAHHTLVSNGVSLEKALVEKESDKESFFNFLECLRLLKLNIKKMIEGVNERRN